MVLETGWPSTWQSMAENRLLWHNRSGAQVRVVILIKLFRENVACEIQPILEL